MIRSRLFAAIVSLLAAASCGSEPPSDGAVATSQAPPESLPPLDRPPIDPPLHVTATFGEYRRGHFHAGLDFSTERRIGRPVFAPAAGYVERIRTSGSGFGRALMIRTPDGRTILLAHLDAFDEPIATFVAAVQDSTGAYEAELTPSPQALPVRSGQRIAWTGESGAGPPHLHMEVRYGEWAYNPLRHGLALVDSAPPVLKRVVLEPADDASYVEGDTGPRSFAVPKDTVVVEGRVRVWIETLDGVSDALPRAAPYAAAFEWKGATLECRFERIAWDEDMSAADWVYEGRGAIPGQHPLGLWIAPGFRPSMITATGSDADAGVITVDAPHPLTIVVRDAAENRTEQRIVLRPPASHERGPSYAPSASRRRAAAQPSFEIVPLPGPFVRIEYSGSAPASRIVLGLRGESDVTRPASLRGRRWSAVVRAPRSASAVFATDSAGSWRVDRPLRLLTVLPDSGSEVRMDGAGASYSWTFPRQGVFSTMMVEVDSVRTSIAAPGLEPVGAMATLGPAGWPLRRRAKVSVTIPGADLSHAGLYVRRGTSWALARSDTTRQNGGLEGEAVTIGRTAVFRDVAPPRVGVARTVRIATPAPNRWALQCAIVERGSGVDGGRTHFVVDGRRVPSEWDAERGVLRWRPLRTPAAGPTSTRWWRRIARDWSRGAGDVLRSIGLFTLGCPTAGFSDRPFRCFTRSSFSAAALRKTLRILVSAERREELGSSPTARPSRGRSPAAARAGPSPSRSRASNTA